MVLCASRNKQLQFVCGSSFLGNSVVCAHCRSVEFVVWCCEAGKIAAHPLFEGKNSMNYSRQVVAAFVCLSLTFEHISILLNNSYYDVAHHK